MSVAASVVMVSRIPVSVGSALTAEMAEVLADVSTCLRPTLIAVP